MPRLVQVESVRSCIGGFGGGMGGGMCKTLIVNLKSIARN